jgi:hypothetical protein
VSVFLSTFVKEPRQDIRLGSRLGDDNTYKRVPFWTSAPGAHDAMERLCEAMDVKSAKFPFRIAHSIADNDEQFVLGKDEPLPTDAALVSDKINDRLRHQLTQWCFFVTDDLEDDFVRGFVAGVKGDMRQELCVDALKACSGADAAAPAKNDEL